MNIEMLGKETERSSGLLVFNVSGNDQVCHPDEFSVPVWQLKLHFDQYGSSTKVAKLKTHIYE